MTCFFFKCFKALIVRFKWKKYMYSKKLSQDEKPVLEYFNWGEVFWFKYAPTILGGFDGDPCALRASSRFKKRISTNKTFENFVMKSILGFLSGVFLTYLVFIFFVFQLGIPYTKSTLICSFFGLTLTIGLAFSYKVRCVVLMLLPQLLFSKGGRQALIAYAYILVLTGPAKCTLLNTGILAESLACTQEELKTALKQVHEVINKPIYSMRMPIKQITRRISKIVDKMKHMLLNFKRIVKDLVSVIENGFEWLHSVMIKCNRIIGAPYKDCVNALRNATQECQVKLDPLYSSLCSTSQFSSVAYNSVTGTDSICVYDTYDHIGNSVSDQVNKKLEDLSNHLKNIFHVEIEFSHTFDFDSEPSKSVKEIAAGMINDIHREINLFLTLFDWIIFAFSFFFFYIVFCVLHYKKKFLSSEYYDNKFINKHIQELDLKRAQSGKSTILPLNSYEKKNFTETWSLRMIGCEKRSRLKSVIFLGLVSLKMMIHVSTDYCLFWILTVIHKNACYQTNIDASDKVRIEVIGIGIIATIHKAILQAFQSDSGHFYFDSSPCLPDPNPPDVSRYTHIASLVALTWFLVFLEPYGLRLRHVVMSYYYPVMARKRAIWLYNHILTSRNNFIKYARRHLRRKYVLGPNGVPEGITGDLVNRFMDRCPILRYFCRPERRKECMLCNRLRTLISCTSENCRGLYCENCFNALRNRCTLCLHPYEYGDLLDVSEEKDSSEDEVQLEITGRKLQRRVKRKEASKEKGKQSDIDSSSNTESVESCGKESGSELSYGYQKRTGEHLKLPPRQHGDLRAHPSCMLDLATIEDFLYPTVESDEDNESVWLPEQQKSFLSGLLWNKKRKPSSSSFTNAVIDKSTSEEEIIRLYNSDESDNYFENESIQGEGPSNRGKKRVSAAQSKHSGGKRSVEARGVATVHKKPKISQPPLFRHHRPEDDEARFRGGSDSLSNSSEPPTLLPIKLNETDHEIQKRPQAKIGTHLSIIFENSFEADHETKESIELQPNYHGYISKKKTYKYADCHLSNVRSTVSTWNREDISVPGLSGSRNSVRYGDKSDTSISHSMMQNSFKTGNYCGKNTRLKTHDDIEMGVFSPESRESISLMQVKP